VGAAMLLAPPAVLLAPSAWPAPGVVGAVLALAVLSTALGFVLYYFLIASAGPVTAASVTFLIPIFGVVGGVAVLGDPLGPGLVAGLAAILVGVLLVGDRGVRAPRPSLPEGSRRLEGRPSRSLR
jgi:drug/metabolite transporter (DMT)-like permease